MEWVELMKLCSDKASYHELANWFKEFEANPKNWTYFYDYQVTMGHYEDIYGNVRTHSKKT